MCGTIVNLLVTHHPQIIVLISSHGLENAIPESVAIIYNLVIISFQSP